MILLGKEPSFVWLNEIKVGEMVDRIFLTGISDFVQLHFREQQRPGAP